MPSPLGKAVTWMLSSGISSSATSEPPPIPAWSITRLVGFCVAAQREESRMRRYFTHAHPHAHVAVTVSCKPRCLPCVSLPSVVASIDTERHGRRIKIISGIVAGCDQVWSSEPGPKRETSESRHPLAAWYGWPNGIHWVEAPESGGRDDAGLHKRRY